MTLDSFSTKRIVYLECPSGTGSQASSISRTSVRPSTLRLALSELMFFLNSLTASIPPLDSSEESGLISSYVVCIVTGFLGEAYFVIVNIILK